MAKHTQRELHSFGLGKQLDAMALVRDLAAYKLDANPGKALVALCEFHRRAKEIESRKLEGE